MPKVGIVIPVLNNFVGLAELMCSVRQEIVPLIQPNWVENRGVSGGWNDGIRQAIALGCTHILVSNDDIVYGKKTIPAMFNRLDGRDDVLMTTARNARGNPDLNRLGIDAMAVEGEGDSPDFSCFMILPKLFELVGEFDENFRPAYFEDNDFHYRMKLQGLKGMNLGGAPMFHKGSQTQNMFLKQGKPVVTGEMFEVNRSYYKRKWGGGPGEETFKVPFNDPACAEIKRGWDSSWKTR